MFSQLYLPIKLPLWKVRLLQGGALLFVCLLMAVGYFYFQKDTQVAKAEGQKIEINERIAHREQQRTTLQKIAYEAFKNGLSTQEQIQEKHHEDERNINVYILALPDSTIEALFTDQYGQPKPVTVYK